MIEEAAGTAQTRGEGFDEPIFRAMKQDPESCPLVGRSGRTLAFALRGHIAISPLLKTER